MGDDQIIRRTCPTQPYSPRVYLRTLVKRLSFLQGRAEAEWAARPHESNFYAEEIDALLWLIARFAATSGYGGRIDLRRFDWFLAPARAGDGRAERSKGSRAPRDRPALR